MTERVEALLPMVEAYRLWATGRMSASNFGEIADKAVIAFDEAGAPPLSPEPASDHELAILSAWLETLARTARAGVHVGWTDEDDRLMRLVLQTLNGGRSLSRGAPERETGWLIERHKHPPYWWFGFPGAYGAGWVEDADSAWRFSRKIDAERALRFLIGHGFVNAAEAFTLEHVWIAAPAVSRGPGPEGPWRATKNEGYEGWHVWRRDETTGRVTQWGGLLDLETEIQAIAVRDALNRVAASPAGEGK